MLVWHENQILPAEQYRKAHYTGKTADIAVCQDPNVQKAQLGDKAIIQILIDAFKRYMWSGTGAAPEKKVGQSMESTAKVLLHNR